MNTGTRIKAVLATAAVGLLAGLLPATSAQAGIEPVPAGFKAVQVSAISNSHWWVLGTVPGCGGHRCSAVAVTTNSGGRFHLSGLTSAHANGTPSKATTIRMSVDGVHGWILAPGRAVGFQLWRTANSGLTWSRVRITQRLSVLDVGGGRVWVAGREGTRARAWSAPANATSLAAFSRRLDVPTVNVEGSPTLVAQGAGTALVLNFRPSDRKARAYVVGSSGFTAHPGPSWCNADLGYSQISSSFGTTWVDCPQGTADSYGYSKGGGVGWHLGVGVIGDASRLAVGAVDATHGIVGVQGGGKLFRVSTAGTKVAGHVPALSSANKAFDFIGFTSANAGFAVTGGGRLLRSSDGGRHWHTVAVHS
jgi:hypothetical protein